MPLFNRRVRELPEDASQSATGEKNGSRGYVGRDIQSGRRTRASSSSSMSDKRLAFGQWLKATLPDFFTMIAIGTIGLLVYEASPAPSRSFPVYFSDGDVVYPAFAYPLRKEVVPIWLVTVLATLVPTLIFLILQIRLRSFWDLNNAIVGLLYSLITAAVFQVFLKWLIGGLRPHFLDVCKPAVPVSGQQTGNGFGRIMYDRRVCTGDKYEIDDALESFPSGHTTAAFAGFIFLSLYLNAKLKVFSNHHAYAWKLIAIYIPVLGATLIGGALTIDEFHNWYDILAGAVIGTTMALSAYRMVYASIWDFRFNHIPLMRELPFTYDDQSGAADRFRDAVWTTQAGWGSKGSEDLHSSGNGDRSPGDPIDSSAHGDQAAVGRFADGYLQGRRISRRLSRHSLQYARAGEMV